MKKKIKIGVLSLFGVLLITMIVLLSYEVANNKKLDSKYNTLNKNIVITSNQLNKNVETITVTNTNINTLKQEKAERIKLLEKWKRQNQKLKELLN